MKKLSQIFLTVALAAAALLIRPQHAAAWPLGNIDDPTYGYNVSSGSALNLSGTSPGSATTVAIATAPVNLFHNLEIVATLQGHTGGTMDCYIQTSPDGGTTWVDYVHFPQFAAAAAAITYHVTVAREAGQTANPVVVGTGFTPALAANAIVGGSFGNQIRVVIKSGAGTSLGAAQTIKVYAGI